ncbi:MAG TPA: hypothetical protein ENN17_02985 [bacterium]|nr:hypothetical protein [bacterium]
MLRSIRLTGILLLLYPPVFAETYRNFDAAIYCRVYEVQKMQDPEWLHARFEVMRRWIRVDKVYLETHRDWVVVDEQTLIQAKRYFEDRGIRTSGGITITVDESNRFETYCYTNPEHRKKLKEVIAYTARHFDEVILDDFFFTSCKCASCIEAKGDRSWTDFRLELLTDAVRELILKPAKAVNPDVTMIIKYPNWYEHFQGLGFNLGTQPGLFDRIYTGNETRDPVFSHQHLQNYQSYLIFRYFENLKPGGNAGGWVDTGGLRFLDRYAEQLWLTLFAKAPEITLFDFRQMEYPLRPSLRAEWQGGKTSFDFDEMIAPVLKPDGTWPEETTLALAAGYALGKIDPVLGFLGHPVGIKSYKPFHSTGEDFIHNYLGMIGLPMDLVPEFPSSEPFVFLAETAKNDPDLVSKIKKQLTGGRRVMITSGLLHALQGRGIEDIVELEFTNRKALVREFMPGWGEIVRSDKAILIPQIGYLTNDSWEEVSALDGLNGWPVVHSADYGGGKLFVLTIPDNFADLYHLPQEVLNRIRQTMMPDFYVRLEGPSQIALFVYDNDTFITESFLPEISEVALIFDPRVTALRDLLSGEKLEGEIRAAPRFRGRRFGEDKRVVRIRIKPHSFRVFRAE